MSGSGSGRWFYKVTDRSFRNQVVGSRWFWTSLHWTGFVLDQVALLYKVLDQEVVLSSVSPLGYSELLQSLDQCDNDPVAVARCFVMKVSSFSSCELGVSLTSRDLV